MAAPDTSQRYVQAPTVLVSYTGHWRLFLVAALAAAYVAIYVPTHNALGSGAGVLATVPVIATAWLFGFRAGLLAGLVGILATWLLVAFATDTDWPLWLAQGAGLGGAALVLVGSVTGRLHDLTAQARTELAERKEAEDARRQSADKFRRLVNHAADAFFLHDLQGKIVDANQHARESLGYGQDELIGLPITDVQVDFQLPPKRWNEIGVDETITTEGSHVRKDGTRFPVEVRLRRFESPDGPLFLALARDVTERRQAEEELKQFAARLERSNGELQEFASIAAHDLKEPLRKIQAFCDRILAKNAGTIDDQSLEYLTRMQDAAERMQALITGLLSLTRITTRSQPFQEVDLTEVAKQTVSDLEVRVQELGGLVEVDTLPTIEADPSHMRQLLQNLVSNGLKFHREDTKPVVGISARVWPANGSTPLGLCEITVKDNGIGFEEKYVDNIFNIFQRLHGRGQYEGTGIGLAVCRKIAEHHGGTITARSTIGEGSRFVVTLPVKQPKEHDASIPEVDGPRRL